ncbi:hypothetical protein K9L97_00720 [Candidatus Woesearchaeota archaeon]|nr:hypothetical protein [Candidatus Woesearchaeota archaeon]
MSSIDNTCNEKEETEDELKIMNAEARKRIKNGFFHETYGNFLSKDNTEKKKGGVLNPVGVYEKNGKKYTKVIGGPDKPYKKIG